MSIEVRKDKNLEIVIEPKEVEELRAKIFIPFEVGKVKEATLKQLDSVVELKYFDEGDIWSVSVHKPEVEYDRDTNTFSKKDTIINFGLRKNELGKIEAFASEEIKSIGDKLDEYFKPLKSYSVAKYSTKMGAVGVEKSNISAVKETSAAEMMGYLFGGEVLAEEMQKDKDQDDFQQSMLEEKAELVKVVNEFRKKVGILNPKVHIERASIYLKSGDFIDYRGGDYFNPDYWCFSVHQWSNNGPMVAFGYKLVKYPDKYSCSGGRREYIEPDMSILTVNRNADGSFKDWNTEEGILVKPKIDKQLDEMFNCVEI